jgi:DNA (cytosine-5)-methyltransferase 1
VAQFRYVDLFAGIGGFHAALSALGGECVFVSEIDKEAARVYIHNWGDEVVPLDEVARREGREPAVHGDITQFAPDQGAVTVPAHDILAAGFPCQPFSKSGAQLGVLDRTRGTLFFNILRILEARKPKVIFLENVRNLAGPRHQDTWATIISSLREIGYRVSAEPTVFSPHHLHPDLGGSPQVRDRVFILGVYVGRRRAMAASGIGPALPRGPLPGWSAMDWKPEETPLPWNGGKPLLVDDDTTPEASRYALTASEERWVEAWDDFVRRMLKARNDTPLPGFPLWAEEWRTREALASWKQKHRKQWEETATWKQVFLDKNADFYSDHQEPIDEWRDEWFPYWRSGGTWDWTSVRHDRDESPETGIFFPPSRRKLEWQAQERKSLRECVLHLRPSGIRAKQPNYLPALVAITQTSVVASRSRRLMPIEAARLQGFPDWYEFKYTDDHGVERLQRDAATYKQLGNAVNAGAIYYALRTFLLDNLDDLPASLQDVADNAGLTPDIRQRPRTAAAPIVAPRSRSARAAGTTRST